MRSPQCRKGKERKGATSPSADAADDEDRFAEFWASYPRKVNKQDALRAWTKATKDVDPQVIINGVKRFEFTGDPKFIPHPATWLTNRRWEDERPTGRIEERLMYRCGPDQWRELYTDEVVDHSHLDRYEVRQVEVR